VKEEYAADVVVSEEKDMGAAGLRGGETSK